MSAVEGVHPAGIGAVGEFGQAVDGGDVHGAILVIVADGVGVALFVQQGLEHIPDRVGGFCGDLCAADPGGQTAHGKAVDGAVGAVFAVAQDRDVHGDIRGFWGDGDGEPSVRTLVGQLDGLGARGVGVEAGDGHVFQGNLGGFPGAPGGGQGQAGEVKSLSLDVRGFAAAGDSQLGDPAFRDSVGVAELGFVHAQRIVRPVQVGLGNRPVDTLRGTADGGQVDIEFQLDAVDLIVVGFYAALVVGDVFGGVVVIGVPVEAIGQGTGVHVGYGTDALGGVLVVVIADGGVGIQGLHEANDAADELGAPDGAGEGVVLDGANAVVPELLGAVFRAEDAAYADFAGDAAAGGTALNDHALGIGGGFQRPAGAGVAAAHNAAHAFPGGGQGAGEGGAGDLKVAHGLALVADQAAHIVHAVDRGGAGGILDVAVELAAEGANVALLLVIADDDPRLNGTLDDVYGVLAGGVAADEAGIQGLGAGNQGDLPEGDVKLRVVVHHIMAYQAVVLDSGAVNLQIAHRCLPGAGKQGFAPGGNGDLEVLAVKIPGEGVLLVADAVPGVRNFNVLGQLEVKARLVFTRRDPLVQQEQVFLAGQEIGVAPGAVAFQAGDPDFDLGGGVRVLNGDGGIRRGERFGRGEGQILGLGHQGGAIGQGDLDLQARGVEDFAGLVLGFFRQLGDFQSLGRGSQNQGQGVFVLIVEALAQQGQLQLIKIPGIPLGGEGVLVIFQNGAVYINLIIHGGFQGQSQLTVRRNLHSVGMTVGGEFRGQGQGIPLSVGQRHGAKSTALFHEPQRLLNHLPQGLLGGLFFGRLGFFGGLGGLRDLGSLSGGFGCGMRLRLGYGNRLNGGGADGCGGGFRGHRFLRGRGDIGGFRGSGFLGGGGGFRQGVLCGLRGLRRLRGRLGGLFRNHHRNRGLGGRLRQNAGGGLSRVDRNRKYGPQQRQSRQETC